MTDLTDRPTTTSRPDSRTNTLPPGTPPPPGPPPRPSVPPPPGWYRDPAGGPGLRWWDGTRWTDALESPALDGGPAKINSLALMSVIFSCFGWITMGLGSIVGVILGYRARDQIRASRGAERGEELATAGIIVGWVMIGVLAVLLILGALAEVS